MLPTKEVSGWESLHLQFWYKLIKNKLNQVLIYTQTFIKYRYPLAVKYKISTTYILISIKYCGAFACSDYYSSQSSLEVVVISGNYNSCHQAIVFSCIIIKFSYILSWLWIFFLGHAMATVLEDIVYKLYSVLISWLWRKKGAYESI